MNIDIEELFLFQVLNAVSLKYHLLHFLSESSSTVPLISDVLKVTIAFAHLFHHVAWNHVIPIDSICMTETYHGFYYYKNEYK